MFFLGGYFKVSLLFETDDILMANLLFQKSVDKFKSENDLWQRLSLEANTKPRQGFQVIFNGSNWDI